MNVASVRAKLDSNQQRHNCSMRKALWCRQLYPDNYTGQAFLEALVIHLGPRRSYWRVMHATLVVDQQLSAAALVASVAYHLHSGMLMVRHVLLAEGCMLLAGALLRIYASRARIVDSIGGCSLRSWLEPKPVDSLGSSPLLVCSAAVLTPAFASLTASVSSDTVVACTCGLLLAHLYLHDYRCPREAANLSSCLALACALCATVLMAGRLRSLGQVFALVVLSIEVFVLAPPLHRHVAECLPASHAMLPASFAAAALALLARQSVLLTSSLLCTLALVTLLYPMWLVRLHKFKAQINGPWDEALPRLPKVLKSLG